MPQTSPPSRPTVIAALTFGGGAAVSAAMMLFSARILCLALVLAALPLLAAVAEEKRLHIYNWSDYIAADTIANFTKETGIEVTYDVYDGNEVLEAKLLAGHSAYDIVVPSASPYMARQIAAGAYRTLGKARLPNLKNLDPQIVARAATADPGNAHGVPYLWSVTGIGYNTAQLNRALGEAAPRAYLGRDPKSHTEAHLADAIALIDQLRPYVRKFHSSQYINDLATADLCIALGYSGDVIQARNRAREAESPVEIAFRVPREGAQMSIDMLGIPADAPHPDNAHAFIDYLLRPDVIAAITDAVSYPNPNVAATPLVEREIRDDPGIYPPEAVRRLLYIDLPAPRPYERARTRAWSRMKSG